MIQEKKIFYSFCHETRFPATVHARIGLSPAFLPAIAIAPGKKEGARQENLPGIPKYVSFACIILSGGS